MESIIATKQNQCWLCGAGIGDESVKCTQLHHVFNGPDRKNADKYGLTVYLCFDCHRRVHMDQTLDLKLKRYFQSAAMTEYGWSMDEWRTMFRKNYL